MKLWGKIFSRFTLISLAIIVQLGWLFLFIYRLSAYYMPIAFFFNAVSMVAAIYILNRPGNPLVKMAWIVPILVFPLFGGLLYFLSGGKGPKKKLRRALDESQHVLSPLNKGNTDIKEAYIPPEDQYIAGQCRYLSDYGYPLYQNTDAAYYTDCREGWQRMLEDLRGAQKFIFLEYFIIRAGKMWDPILEILTEKAAAGVEVRILYDDFGCVASLPRHYEQDMEARGIRCVAFNRYRPIYSVIMNHRDHRKIMVIDGLISYTGGSNLSDEYINEWERFGIWKDNFVRLEGEATRSMTLMFLQMWNANRPADRAMDASKYMPDPVAAKKVVCSGYVQPYADSPMDNEVLAENVYLNIINQSTKYVYICSPYVVVDYEMTRALCLAARRGVDVRLLAPGIPDKRTVYELSKSHFPELVRNGVKVYTYTPGFVHSKCFVSDDRLAVVGTINLDYRSLTLHFENACLFVDHPVVAEVRQDFEDTFPDCAEVGPDTRRFGVLRAFWLGILRLFAPLM